MLFKSGRVFRSVQNSVDRFLFVAVDVGQLNIFRKSLGWICLLWAVVALPRWERDYSNAGMLRYVPKVLEGKTENWFSVIDYTADWLPVNYWWLLIVVLSIQFIRGWHPRTMAFGLALLHTFVNFRNIPSSNAEQGMMRMLFFYSAFMPFEQANCSEGQTLAPPWSIRMAQFHMCCIYLVSTAWKVVSDPAWLDGEAMYWVLIHPLWSKFWIPDFLLSPLPIQLLTWGSLLFEGAYGILVWTSARKWVAPMMIGFHVAIAVFLNHVGFFSMVTAVGHVLFLRRSDLQAWARLWPLKARI